MTHTELNEARELRQRIRDEERRLDALRVAAQNIVPILDGMPHERSQASKVEKVALLVFELERELAALKTQFESACVNITRKLRQENLDAQEFEILLLRYVACMNFRDIQCKLDVSDARVFYIHRNALKKLKPLFTCSSVSSL